MSISAPKLSDAEKKKSYEAYQRAYPVYHLQSADYRKNTERSIRFIARWNVPAFLKD